jgi:hypothetical protein
MNVAVPIAIAALSALAFASPAPAQTPPATYSLEETNSFIGFPITMKIYRDGAQALIDQSYPPRADNPKGFHVRTVYDLKAGTNATWDELDPSGGCGRATVSGDWGDPFVGSGMLLAGLDKAHIKELGNETINGIATKVSEATAPGNPTVKVWFDSEHGLLVKAVVTEAKSTPRVLVEVTKVSYTKPAASNFTLPAICTAAPVAAAPPEDIQRFAAETGGDVADLASAITPPSTKPKQCKVQLRAVRAGSMAPLSGFQLSIDNKPQNGKLTFDALPDAFDVDFSFGDHGGGAAHIYRQCAGDTTVLLMVVKNPESIGEGVDWVWAKSGKLAAAK